jgi:multiple sugar transport system permease protein
MDEFRGKRIFHTVYLIPMMIVPAVTGYMFFMLFQSNGPINAILSIVSGKAVEIPWLSTEIPAIVSVIIAEVWQWTPLMFLLLLAGLRGLPVDVLEAARVDGANAIQTLVQVKLPIMKNVVLVAVLLRFLDAVRTYDAIYVLTRGGPASATDAYTMYTFRAAFAHFNVNTAAALSLVFLVLLSILVPMLFFRLLGMKMDA